MAMNDEELPAWVQCPILQTVMMDPVIALDGHTYERSAIQQWFSIRCASPITNLPLTNSTLLPNMALRTAIEQWLATNPRHRRIAIASASDHTQSVASSYSSTLVLAENQIHALTSPELLQLIQAIAAVTRESLTSLDMTVTDSIRPDKACHFYEPHFRLMRWIGGKLPRGTRVWNLGSHDSLAPTAIADNASLIVDVYNVEWFGGVAVHNNIHWHHLDDVPWAQAHDVQVIVIELHPHNGIYHRTVLQKLIEAQWQGLLCIGAVDVNDDMVQLWQEVQGIFSHKLMRYRCGYVVLDGLHRAQTLSSAQMHMSDNH